MVSDSDGGGPKEATTPNGYETNGSTNLDTSMSPMPLLRDENRGGKLSLIRFSSDESLPSPSAKLRQIAEERDAISRSIPFSNSNSQGLRKRFNGILGQKFDWPTLRKLCKEWFKCPLNMVLFLWIVCVAISGAILFLVMTGMLNRVLPKKSQRNAWFEVNNQILNALFTLMCLYQHPKRIHHLVLLCRWKPQDVSALRNVYCKNGTYKPREWVHMMVVIVLLHVNCFAQYALCGLNLGYRRSERPAIGVGICLSIAIGAPAVAGLYCIVSPLGKDYDSDSDSDPEAPDQNLRNGGDNRRSSLEKRYSFSIRSQNQSIVYAPVWKGGLFDLWDDITVSYLSLFFSFCVFGWNMERLGFGNMYVHIATFLLFCSAPFWIFNLAAVNIDNETVRQGLVSTGVILCIFGLLYGGFWRIQMRKRFNLPPNTAFCKQPAVADCAQWLFCCWCSLAQEVRTADYYNIMEDKFCRKKRTDSELTPLPPEDRSVPIADNGFYLDRKLSDKRDDVDDVLDSHMKPPVMLSIHRESDTNHRQ